MKTIRAFHQRENFSFRRDRLETGNPRLLPASFLPPGGFLQGHVFLYESTGRCHFAKT
jgi:hypothetical protein